MKSLLIFAPGWTPFSPYLALPTLKGFLEKHGTYIDIKDYNVEFYDYMFSSKYLENLIENKVTFDNKEQEIKFRLFKQSINSISLAKSVIRSNEFYNLNKREMALDVIKNAIFIINNSFDNLNLSFNGIKLKHSEYSSIEVIKALDDEHSNPFISFFKDICINEINKNQYNFIGISITGNSQLISALTLAKLIKTYCPQVKHITLGGNYITRAVSRWDSKHSFFDIIDSVILYEGEEPLLKLINAIGQNLSLADVPNLMYVSNEKLCKNNIISSDIKNACAPNFDGFALDKYFLPELVLPLYTSRCCLNKCAFCTIPSATYGQYRTLEINDVYLLMKSLKSKYKNRIFTFVDETFEVSRMYKLSQLLNDNKDQFYWFCETRFSKTMTKEICKSLYKSGCRNIQFGLESYNQRVLDKMNKNIKIQWIDSNIEDCITTGISVHMFFMVGFPTETKDEALRTFKYTEDILNRCKRLNLYSTRGFGTFGLDKYSDVWYHPKEYKISIQEKDSEDLRLNVDYISHEGLSHEESESIVNSHQIKHILGDLPDNIFLLNTNIDISEDMLVLDSINKFISSEDVYKVKISTGSMPKTTKIKLNQYTSYTSTSDGSIKIYNYYNNSLCCAPKDFDKILELINYDNYDLCKIHELYGHRVDHEIENRSNRKVAPIFVTRLSV